MITKLTIEQFITKSNIVHNNRYNYDLVEYVNSRTKIKIICPIHGEYEQVAKEHLRGRGCSKCAYESKALILTSQAKSEFKDKASLVHNNKYDYSLVEYINSRTKIKIICPVHGTWEQKANDHLNGQGCPLCAKEASGWTRSGFKSKCDKNNNGLGILYILECFNENEHFFKIGITSRSIKQRYSSKVQMPYAYSIVKEIVGDPEFIYDLETKLHREYKQYQYIPLIPFGGHLTECFNTYMGVNQ